MSSRHAHVLKPNLKKLLEWVNAVLVAVCGKNELPRPVRLHELPIRPEKIALHEPGAVVSDAEVFVDGVVREGVYLGMYTRFIVSLDAGGELIVVEQNIGASHKLDAARGKPVRAVWHRDFNRPIKEGG